MFSFFLLERLGLPLNTDVALRLSLTHEKGIEMACVTFRWQHWESVCRSPPHFLSAMETSDVPESACSISKSPRVKIAGGRSLSWPEIKTQGWDCMFWFFGGQGMWNLSSLTRDGTCTPCSGRPSLNYWTSREVPQSAITTKQLTPKFSGLKQHWFIFSLMCLWILCLLFNT